MSLEVNITKKLDGFTLHANFAARSTATAILGASGCGKSMTLALHCRYRKAGCGPHRTGRPGAV